MLSSLLTVVLAFQIICMATHAQAGPLPAGADEGGWLDRYNRLVFRFNGVVDRGLEDVAAWFGQETPEAPRRHVRGHLSDLDRMPAVGSPC